MGRWYRGAVSLDSDKLWAKSPNERYWVSEYGDIVNVETGYKLKPTKSQCGYMIISRKTTGFGSVHRLVYSSFIGEIPDGLEINHLDGDKENNHISNLEACTSQENAIHAHLFGLSQGKVGQENSMAKVTEHQVLGMYQLFKLGYNNRQVAEIYGLHDRYVSLIRHGKRWSYLWLQEEMRETISSGNLPFEFPKCSYIAAVCMESNELNKDLAERFGLDRSTISRIRSKKTWKSLFETIEISDEV